MSQGDHFLLRWREVVASKHGPTSPTTRHVLLTLSLRGDSDGSRIYPSTRLLSECTGLTERTVCTHVERAEQEGWIERSSKGTGHGWRRMIYTPRFPADVLKEVQQEGTEGGSAPEAERTEPPSERAEPDDTNVLKEVQSTSSVTSPKTSPSPPEGADAPGKAIPGEKKGKPPTWVQRAGAVWAARMEGTPPFGRLGKALKPHVKEHGEEEVVRVLDSYLGFLVSEGRADFATPEHLAQRFGQYRNGKAPGKGKAKGAPRDIDHEDIDGWNKIRGPRTGGP